MTKLYEKNKLTFALIWIGIYVVSASFADSFSEAVGIEKIITAPLLLIISGIILFWILKSGLSSDFGLCNVKGRLSYYIWFIPLLVLVTQNLWNGVRLNLSIFETVLYILSMMCVGFIEEIIFRGFLFKSLCDNGIKTAFIISSVTFGIGHIVNLINGAEILPTILQIVYATAVGFLFTSIFYKSSSLIPCIITHGVFNSLSAFGIETDVKGQIISAIVMCVIVAAYSVFILFYTKKQEDT